MLQFVSAGVSLAQGIMGSSSAKKAAKRKARMIRMFADYNARVKEMEAESILNTLKAETKRDAKSIYSAKATQKVAQSKDLSKTPMSVIIDQATEMELGIQNNRRNRLIEANYEKQVAKTTRYQGEIQAQQAIADGKRASQQALMGGIMGAVSGFGKGMTALSAASEAGKELTFTQKILS